MLENQNTLELIKGLIILGLGVKNPLFWTDPVLGGDGVGYMMNRGVKAVSFLPDEVDDMIVWFDANDSDTITEISDAVSQWNDKSGQDNHVATSNGKQ